MASFAREELKINGIRTEMLTAGRGEPLMFWHGAGTIGGFDFALPWAERFKVMIPFHPGWGGSADDDAATTMQDFVLHYLDLLDQLRLEHVRLVGLSMGGWMAATFASQQPQRVTKLALVAPAGLRVPQHPSADVFRLRPEQVAAALVVDFEVLRPHLPRPDDIDAIVQIHREQTSFARIAWERMSDPKLPRWLHRIKAPTLLVWGEQDRIIPYGQAQTWAQLIPGAQVRGFKNVGHLVLNESADAVKAVAEFMA